jgi:NAD kinase
MLPLRPTTSERGECHDSTRSSKDPTGHEVFNKPVWTILILTKLVDLPFANFVEALASYLLSFDDPPLPPSPLKASPCSAQGKALKIETDIKKSSPVSPHWRPGSPHRRRVVFVDARFQPYFERFHIKNENSKLAQVQDRIKYWNPEFCATCYENIDLILTMGGDGTVLYTSWLFQRCSVPPLMPFYFGSLGFLTDFKISNIKKHLKPLLLHSIHPETKEPCTQSKLTINKRMRLSVTVYRAPRKGRLSINVLKSDIYNDMQQSNIWTEFPEEIHPLLSPIGDRAISASSQHSMEAKMEAKERRASMVDALVDDLCLRTRAGSLSSIPPHLDSLATPSRSAHQLLTDKGAPVPTENFHVLNEVVVDRGPSAYMSQLDLFVDGKPLTAVQADGLVLSTPTGSTAYSVHSFFSYFFK